MRPAKLQLAHLPTPLVRHDALDALVGTRVWVKRDDMSAGVAAGNKIRKLEYLLADALSRGATVIVTCGALYLASLGSYLRFISRMRSPASPPSSAIMKMPFASTYCRGPNDRSGIIPV